MMRFVSQETEQRIADVLFALAEKGAIADENAGLEMILNNGLDALGRKLGLVWNGDESKVPLDALFKYRKTE